MPGEQRSCILFDDDADHGAFSRNMLSKGWRIEATDKTGREGSQSIEEVWVNPTQTIAVHYLDNPRMMSRALWIRGRDIWPVVMELCSIYGGPSPDDLFEDASTAETVEDRVKTIFRLAVVFKDAFYPTTFDIFSHYVC